MNSCTYFIAIALELPSYSLNIVFIMVTWIKLDRPDKF